MTTTTCSTRLREDLDLDSFDFVRLVTALDERLGVGVPEADYRKLETLDGCLDYFSKQTSWRRPPGALQRQAPRVTRRRTRHVFRERL